MASEGSIVVLVSVLIMSLVGLTVISIGVVARLLTIELGKPRVQKRKIIEKLVEVEVEKVIYLAADGNQTGAAVTGTAAKTAIAADAKRAASGDAPKAPEPGATVVMDRPSARRRTQRSETPRPRPQPRPRPRPQPRGSDIDLYSPPGRQRKMRMRDVVERGEGVRVSIWRKIRSFVSLIMLVGLLGAGAAALVGAIVLFIAFFMAQALG